VTTPRGKAIIGRFSGVEHGEIVDFGITVDDARISSSSDGETK
jgi:hypothetical protein